VNSLPRPEELETIIVTLPSDVVEAMRIKENMDVKISIQKTQRGFGVSELNKAEDDPWRLLE
jgi:hypothetical protein